MQKPHKNTQKSGKRVKNTCKNTQTRKNSRKNTCKNTKQGPKNFLTHVDFGPFFGRPGFPQKLALLLQPLPGMTGAAEKNFF